MIASLDGTVASGTADSIVVEVGGIGYRVQAAPSLIASAQPGRRIRILTFHLVREDTQALYGFATPEELGFFTLLLTVTGVGPKVALSIVGSRPVAELQLAILQDDQAVLVAIPGVGKRLAARVVLELKEKVAAAGLAAATSDGRPVGDDDVLAALQALGYTAAEARTASRAAVAETGPGAGLEERVKAALKALAR